METNLITISNYLGGQLRIKPIFIIDDEHCAFILMSVN